MYLTVYTLGEVVWFVHSGKKIRDIFISGEGGGIWDFFGANFFLFFEIEVIEENDLGL